MSHVEKIEIEIKSFDILKKAVERLGGSVLNKKTYVWYGRHVGDYPMPEGFTEQDLGKCDYALNFPGCRYEVGVVNRNGKSQLLWDFYDRSLLIKLGNGGGLLKQAYAVETAKAYAKKKRYRYKEQNVDGKIQITINV